MVFSLPEDENELRGKQSSSEEKPENQRRDHGKRQTYPKNVPHMTKFDALRGFNVR
jgi:hypothetical protein